VTIKSDIGPSIGQHIASAWPGTTLTAEPTPLTGGFWASMYRVQLDGQPDGVPSEVVFRIAPDAAMGLKELTVQRAVAELGYPTPAVRLTGHADDDLGGTWSVMDFAEGTPPLGDLNGIAVLRRAPRLFGALADQLAGPMAALHALDPEPVSAAVSAAAPGVAWRVKDLLEHYEAVAHTLGRADLVAGVAALAERQPPEGATVICHGDLHPFNLLIDDRGVVTVIDWTGAIRAEPAFDVAFTSLLLANPPLDAPGPLGPVIGWVGARLARRFVARYQALAPDRDLRTLDWYRGLHGARALIEIAVIDARPATPPTPHPFRALLPAATRALTAATGT